MKLHILSYNGKPLVSRQKCYWKVRVWDRDKNVSNWSRPASWEMGMLAAADWNARWIESGFKPDHFYT